MSSIAVVPNHDPGGPPKLQKFFKNYPKSFPCLLNQTHLIQIISSLVETPRPEMGVSDNGEMQNVQYWGASRNMVGTTDLYQKGGQKLEIKRIFELNVWSIAY